MIISHAGTMSVLLSYFLNMPLYAWTWRKLFQDTGYTTLKSTQISGGTFSDLKSLIMSLLPIVTKNKHTKIILTTKIMPYTRVLPEVTINELTPRKKEDSF